MFGRLEAWFVRRPAGTFCGRGRVAALPLHAPFSVLRSPGRLGAPHAPLPKTYHSAPQITKPPISQHTIRHPQALSFGKSLVLLEGLRLIPYMMSDKARNGRRRARSAAKPPSNQLISRMLHWSTHVFAIPIFLGQYCRFPFFWAAAPPFCYTVG